MNDKSKTIDTRKWNEITYKDITGNEEIRTYIEQSDYTLNTMGYTMHGTSHVCVCANIVEAILKEHGSDQREVELGKIAAYMHDIGNMVNRVNHALTGATMAFTLLRDLGMKPKDIGKIVSAIGAHDEKTASVVNPMSAALILADKMDVRRSRVREKKIADYDIHDRVNYAVFESNHTIENNVVALILSVDTDHCSVMEYFGIFLDRMTLCKTAAEFLGFKFSLTINNLEMAL